MMHFMKLRFSGLFFLIMFASAALQGQTLEITPVDATCLQNGALSWEVEGVGANADINYLVNDVLSGNTIAGPIDETSLSGLPPSDYEVVANIVDGNDVITIMELATIGSSYVALEADVNIVDERCGNDGRIEVTVNAGIFKSLELTGPITSGPSTTLSIEDLTEGQYNLILIDSCDNSQIVGITISKVETEFTSITRGALYDERWRMHNLNCDEIIANVNFNKDLNTIGEIAVPLTFTFTIHPPFGGDDIIVTETRTSLNPWVNNFVIPWYPGVSYSYDLKIEDACGYVFSVDNTIVLADKTLSFGDYYSQNCFTCHTIEMRYTRGDVFVEFVSAPAGFNPPDFIQAFPGHIPLEDSFNDEMYVCSGTEDVPDGQYVLRVTDDCGTKELVYNINGGASFRFIRSFEHVSCIEGESDILLNFSEFVESIEIINAPPSFNQSLPYDASQFIGDFDNSGDYQALITNLVSGTYELRAISTCGEEITFEVEVVGLIVSGTTYDILAQCNSFDLFFNEEVNGFDSGIRRTQYFLYHDGIEIREINLDGLTTNITEAGTFEIWRQIFQMSEPNCFEKILEFEYDNSGIDMVSLSSLRCEDGSYVLISEVIGPDPITYSIVEIDGQPANIDNGNESIFTGLEFGEYKVQASNDCGSVIRDIEVTDASEPQITGTICDNETGCLSVVGFDFLNFSWYHVDEPTEILSEDSQLCFTDFDSSIDGGEYAVRLSFDADLTCFDKVLFVNVSGCCSDPDDGCDLTEDTFDSENCVVTNTPINEPEKENCWDEFIFNEADCAWVNTGTQPDEPSVFNCWDSFTFSEENCEWINEGSSDEVADLQIALLLESIGDCEQSITVSIEQSNGSPTYLWSTGETSETIIVQGNQDYSVTVTDECDQTVTDFIDGFSDEVDLQFPNVFFPNAPASDVNRTFGPYLPCPDQSDITEYRLEIYNRWGNRVFESNNLSSRWTGSLNNLSLIHI